MTISLRKQGLTYSEDGERCMAAPFWSTIEHMPEDEKRRMLPICASVFRRCSSTGRSPSSSGFTGGMMALNDRLKLRSAWSSAETEDMAYVASEECAIRRGCARMLTERLGAARR